MATRQVQIVVSWYGSEKSNAQLLADRPNGTNNHRRMTLAGHPIDDRPSDANTPIMGREAS